MSTESAAAQPLSEPADRSRTGIGIGAVEAAARCCRSERRTSRLTQDQVKRLLPYQEVDCCTD